MSTVAALLAADAGPGFVPSKYLADVSGEPLLAQSLRSALSWPVDELFVVLGPDADAVEDGVDLSEVSVLVDPSADEGLASPMRAVLDLVGRDSAVTHLVVGLGDQPGVSPADVAALIDRARESSAEVVVPKYRYAVGFPVVLGVGIWDVFLRLEGGIAIHDVVAAHARSVEEVWIDHVAARRILEPDDLPGRRR